ncbi:MAG: HAMP domain-containing sensor histidine kinase [Pseudomonadota bacterium]
MSFKTINKITGKIGFRLVVWYSGLILAGMVILFLITYFFLSSTLKTRDRQEIQSEISELTSEFNSGGIEGIKSFIHSHLSKRLKSILYIRIADTDNKTAFQYSPVKQKPIHLQSLEHLEPFEDEWVTIEIKENNLELNFQTKKISAEYILQVGISSGERDAILNHFLNLFITRAIPLIILGILGGVFLSFRTLKPLRNIISTVEAIDIGRMDSRVPRTGTHDELDDLARLFNEMLDKISNLLTGMKDSLDNVAHDLRTPLTRLRNISEIAMNELPEGSPGRRVHESMLEELERILKMLSTLMDISEAETGTMILNKEHINLYNLVFPIYDLYLVVAESKDIQIKMNIPSDITIFADPNKISQAIANLLDNAVKFTPNNGMIEINAHRENNQVIITITDNGLGIAEQDILKIWNRLFRGDLSRSQKGLGLGLSLVKAIVNAHQGDITVSSKPNNGTTFSIFLPEG